MFLRKNRKDLFLIEKGRRIVIKYLAFVEVCYGTSHERYV